MDKYLEAVVKNRLTAGDRLKEIVATAEEEKRALSPEDQENLKKANEDYDRFTNEEKDLRDYHGKVKATDELRASIEPALRDMREQPRENPNAWLIRAHNAAVHGPGGEEFESMRTIPLGYQARALQSAGGSAIETTFADFVTVYERTLNPMLQVSNVISTRTGAPIVLPRVTADNTAGGSVTAEAGGITENDATISSVTLTAFKIASTTLYSAELDQDEVIGLDQLLANAISRPIGLGWGTFFTTGDGSGKPKGFLAAATNGGTAGGTATGTSVDKYWSATDLVTLFYTLAAPYRGRGSWMTNSVAKMRSFKDANGNFIWTPGNLALGQPDTFLGRPVYENPAMAAAGSANTAIAFGDFSAYVIRDVTPMRIDISKDYKFATDQLALRVVTRRDGNLPDAQAIQFLVSQAI